MSCVTTKPLVGLFTWPVGAKTVKPGGATLGGAIIAGDGGDSCTPFARWSEVRPVPVSEIQNGLVVGVKETPQGLTRLTSTVVAPVAQVR